MSLLNHFEQLHPGQSAQLPQGWVREFDPGSGKMFYVDLTTGSPSATWDYPASEAAASDVQTFAESHEEEESPGWRKRISNKLKGGTDQERDLWEKRRNSQNEVLDFSRKVQKDPSYAPTFDPPTSAPSGQLEEAGHGLQYGNGTVGGQGTGMSGLKPSVPGLAGGMLGRSVFS
ncbi:hypothetical protein T439DRAFT_325181 [Meredithblackwellia eburnea MCA 4105]